MPKKKTRAPILEPYVEPLPVDTDIEVAFRVSAPVGGVGRMFDVRLHHLPTDRYGGGISLPLDQLPQVIEALSAAVEKAEKEDLL